MRMLRIRPKTAAKKSADFKLHQFQANEQVMVPNQNNKKVSGYFSSLLNVQRSTTVTRQFRFCKEIGRETYNYNVGLWRTNLNPKEIIFYEATFDKGSKEIAVGKLLRVRNTEDDGFIPNQLDLVPKQASRITDNL